METRFNFQAYWSNWIDTLIPWLLTHGIRIVLLLVFAYIFNFLARRVIIKVIRVSVTADYHQSVVAERKRENTLIQIFTWSARVLNSLAVEVK